MDIFICAPVENNSTVGILFQIFNAGVFQTVSFVLYAPVPGSTFDDVLSAADAGIVAYALANSFTINSVGYWFNLPATASKDGLMSATDKTKLDNLATSAYKSFQSLVSQSGTSAPTETVLNNDFTGTTFTLARTSAGVYTLTASTLVFTSGKTAVLSSPTSSPLNNISVVRTSGTVLTISTSSLNLLALGVAGADSILSNTLLEVRVYP